MRFLFSLVVSIGALFLSNGLCFASDTDHENIEKKLDSVDKLFENLQIRGFKNAMEFEANRELLQFIDVLGYHDELRKQGFEAFLKSHEAFQRLRDGIMVQSLLSEGDFLSYGEFRRDWNDTLITLTKAGLLSLLGYELFLVAQPFLVKSGTAMVAAGTQGAAALKASTVGEFASAAAQGVRHGAEAISYPIVGAAVTSWEYAKQVFSVVGVGLVQGKINGVIWGDVVEARDELRTSDLHGPQSTKTYLYCGYLDENAKLSYHNWARDENSGYVEIQGRWAFDKQIKDGFATTYSYLTALGKCGKILKDHFKNTKLNPSRIIVSARNHRMSSNFGHLLLFYVELRKGGYSDFQGEDRILRKIPLPN